MQVITSKGNLTEQPVCLDDVKTVVVRDGFGNPIFVAIQQDEYNILAVDASDPRFEKIVADLPLSRQKLVVQRG